MGLSPFRRAGSLSSHSASPSKGSSGRRSRLKSRTILFGLMAALFLFAVGCSKDGMSTWDALGPVAEKQLELFNVLMWVMVAVFVLVEGVLVYAIVRYRARPGQPKPPQIHGNNTLEITLTIIPTILVLGLGIWSVFTLFDLDQPPTDGSYRSAIPIPGDAAHKNICYRSRDKNAGVSVVVVGSNGKG